MKRNELTEAFREASMAAGYAFHAGEVHKINSRVRVYPAAWMEPAVLSSVEGRREGDVKYRVAVHLMSLPAAEGENETLRAQTEADALAIVRRVMADGCVREVSEIACTPTPKPLTAHGEVAVTLTCDVTMWFYL